MRSCRQILYLENQYKGTNNSAYNNEYCMFLSLFCFFCRIWQKCEENSYSTFFSSFLTSSGDIFPRIISNELGVLLSFSTFMTTDLHHISAIMPSRLVEVRNTTASCCMCGNYLVLEFHHLSIFVSFVKRLTVMEFCVFHHIL